MAGEITNILKQMYDSGIYDFIFPFILFFGIFYAILYLLPVFGKLGDDDKKNKIATIASLVLSLIVVVPHVTGSYEQFGFGVDPVKVIIDLASTSTGIVVTIFFFLIVAYLFGASLHKSLFTNIFIVLIFIFLVYFVLNKFGIINSNSTDIFSFILQPSVIAIASVVMILAFMIMPKREKDEDRPINKINKDLTSAFWPKEAEEKKEEKKK